MNMKKKTKIPWAVLYIGVDADRVTVLFIGVDAERVATGFIFQLNDRDGCERSAERDAWQTIDRSETKSEPDGSLSKAITSLND